MVLASLPSGSPCQAAEQPLIPADIAYDDYFGEDVGISGDTIIVGAPYDDDLGGSSGSAYIFTLQAGVWSEHQKLVAADGQSADWFGVAVAIDRDWAVVGATLEDQGGTSAGAAYVFHRVAGSWSQYAKLVPADAQSYDHFGAAVAVSGHTIAVGAPYSDDAGEGTGSVYVFHLDGGLWIEQPKLLAADMDGHDNFGSALAIDGDTLLISSPQDGDACDPPLTLCNSGSAYVFTRSGGTWSQAAKLVASDDEEGDFFGVDVDLDGGVALIGAFKEDEAASNGGAAYVFSGAGGGWSEDQKLMAADAESEDHLGEAVALAGRHALLAAPGEDQVSNEAGAIYTFDGGSSWFEVAKIPSNAPAHNEFGEALDGDGFWFVVGCHYHDYSAGRAYAYRLEDLNPGVVFADDFAEGTTWGWASSTR
jgi:hypothetical protein